MKDFIKYLVEQIVIDPSQVRVEESNENGVNVYTIHCAQDDIKLIIGKAGHIIKSIRNLVKAKAIKDNKMVRILIEDHQYDAI